MTRNLGGRLSRLERLAGEMTPKVSAEEAEAKEYFGLLLTGVYEDDADALGRAHAMRTTLKSAWLADLEAKCERIYDDTRQPLSA